ncbi:MAG: HAMP domain-containing protein [Methylocystaceae bacterium]|nr:HAMP domain-containing protein [Methylocystaceae bacterium]
MTLKDDAMPLTQASLRTKLSFSFAALCALILISLVLTIFKSNQVDRSVERIVENNIPIAFSEGQLASEVNASLAALRGWVLTNNDQFKAKRALHWKNINTEIKILDRFLGQDTSWQKLKTDLIAFKTSQKKVEAIAHSIEDLPATQLLNTEVTPLTDGMLSDISQAYIEEINRDATPIRKKMLGQMGDLRSALAVVTGNVRAYLLTGEKHYADQYQAVWGWAMGQLAALEENQVLLSPTQEKFMSGFSASAQKVTPLFSKLIELRRQPDWNRSRALLVTDVTPLAERILTRLSHPKTGLVVQKRLEMEEGGHKAVTAVRNLTTTSYLLGVLAVVLSALMVVLSLKTIVNPLRKITRIMTELAHGHENITIPDQERRDEIGAMAKALNVFKENSEERLRLEAEQNKDQLQRAKRAQKIEELSHNFDATIRQVLEETEKSTARMQESAQSLQTTAQTTLEQTRSVASASDQTQSNVQHVAGATGQLSASFGEISANASKSMGAIQDAIAKGENASQTVHWMSEASERIGEVVSMIADIAAQTNLLALNATIEAARAGDAGKGFAVVAGEVKNLANQTARATQEITEHIKRMQETTNQSVAAIQEVCVTISNVGDQAASVRETVEQQSLATQDISANVGDVAQHAAQISDNIKTVEGAATQTNVAADHVLQDVGDVSTQADQLKSQVVLFLNGLKSA